VRIGKTRSMTWIIQKYSEETVDSIDKTSLASSTLQAFIAHQTFGIAKFLPKIQQTKDQAPEIKRNLIIK
jgi:hypothetical protein